MSNPAVESYNLRLEQMIPVVEHYKKGLRNIDDGVKRGNISVIIENQRQYLEKMGPKIPEFLVAISVQATVHALTAIPDFISFQASRGETEDVCYHLTKAGDVNSMKATVYKLNTQPSVMMKNINLNGIDDEEIGYQSIEMAVTMAEDISQVAVEAMSLNADHQIKTELKSEEQLIDAIQIASDAIKSSTGKAANFIILPVVLAKAMKSYMVTEYEFDALPINIKRIGVMKNKWVVYINGYELKRILVGYRGTHPVDAAYIYTPSLLLCDPKLQDKGTPKERYLVSKRGRHHLVRPDYLASLELIIPNNKDSIEAF